MARVSVNGISVNYQEAGAGFPLILIHGLSDSSALWAPLMPKLSKYYHTIALDLRGHGESEKPNMLYSIQLFSEDLLLFLQTLEIQEAHVLGFSIGAAVAQQLALDHPEKIRSLILLSPFSYRDSNLQGNLKRLRESVIKGGLSAFFDEGIKLVVTHDFVSANSDAIAQMKNECARINSPTAILHAIDACMNFDIKDRISRISLPTLIISGRQDIMSRTHLAEQIHLSIKGADWKIMEGVGHNLLVPDKIPALTEMIVNFLKRQ